MLLERYLPRIEFDSYEDFKQNYQVNVPDNFNFAYDIVDEWAKLDNTKKALVWCDDHGSEREFTFEELAPAIQPGSAFLWIMVSARAMWSC